MPQWFGVGSGSDLLEDLVVRDFQSMSVECREEEKKKKGALEEEVRLAFHTREAFHTRKREHEGCIIQFALSDWKQSTNEKPKPNNAPTFSVS